jgi:lysophospholipase L1-like esterase
MADASGQLPADEAEDGLHPNAKGYRILSPVAVQAIDRALAATAVAEPAPAKQKRRFGILQ